VSEDACETFWKPGSGRLDRFALEKKGIWDFREHAPIHFIENQDLESLDANTTFALSSKNSPTRPGMPMTISRPWNRNLLMSSAGSHQRKPGAG
jgi:hypothetical protein